MPQQTDHPTGSGSLEDSWALGAGASKASAVAGNDGDTSYVKNSFGDSYQTYVMPTLPSSAGSVTSVVEHVLARKFASTGTNQVGVLTKGLLNAGLGNTPLTYTEFQAVWNANLTVAEVNAAESGIRGFDTAGGENRCTELWRVTDYALAPAGYFFIMGSLLGAALQLADVAAAAQYLNARERALWQAWRQPSMTTIKAAEIPAAYADIRAYRHPRFFSLGRA